MENIKEKCISEQPAFLWLHFDSIDEKFVYEKHVISAVNTIIALLLTILQNSYHKPKTCRGCGSTLWMLDTLH